MMVQYMMRFVSYPTGSMVEVFFDDEKRAREVYDAARRARDAWLRQAPDRHDAFVPFDVTDDYGVSVSINLLNHFVIFSSAEDLVRRNAVTSRASRDLQRKHDLEDEVGFMTTTVQGKGGIGGGGGTVQ